MLASPSGGVPALLEDEVSVPYFYVDASIQVQREMIADPGCLRLMAQSLGARAEELLAWERRALLLEEVCLGGAPARLRRILPGCRGRGRRRRGPGLGCPLIPELSRQMGRDTFQRPLHRRILRIAFMRCRRAGAEGSG